MPQLSEQRARAITREILSFRGWDIRPVASGGQLLEESEYRAHANLIEIFEGRSKTGPGFGKPDFLLVDSHRSLKPLVVIDTKPQAKDIKKSIKDTNHYGDAIHEAGQAALSVAIAGAERELYEVRVQRKIEGLWCNLTLHDKPIDWVPSPVQTSRILSLEGRTEVAAERPPDHVLTDQARRLNEILRECTIKDEYRPIYAATFMLGLWHGNVSTDSDVVLDQINANAAKALKRADKAYLSHSLRVDSENESLSEKAWQIIDILKKLNIRSFSYEHDYLGQLYETFFRYTGGNTIGQYFTPRHIIDMMCDLVEVSPDDVVFDPACGTGGFLIGALRRMIRMQNLSYEDAVKRVRRNIYGMESEPATAALCITNMILRGDGKSGVIQKDCFVDQKYPPRPINVALLNPPFPHKKTDTPSTKFIDRALSGLSNKGLVSSVVPYSLLVRMGEWHRKILKNNRLVFVATMPPDLFEPYASFNTAVIAIQKGIPHDGAKVFFARLFNDGYKVKKKTRIPQPGSQIETILKAFDAKKEIPELTAYKNVTEDASGWAPEGWAPEAFIAAAPRKDEEFIEFLEQSIRQQAAFYVSHGHRLIDPDGASSDAPSIEPSSGLFSAESSLDLSDVKQGRFRISDHFHVQLGGKDEIEDLRDGSIPVVSTSQSENGVTTWRSPNVIYPPRAITVATDGSTCSSFVQEFPFYAFYKVAILRPLKQVPIDSLYFIACLLSRERWRYVYARKFGKARIRATILHAPIKKDGTPDFVRMAKLVRRCVSYPMIVAFRLAYEASAQGEDGMSDVAIAAMRLSEMRNDPESMIGGEVLDKVLLALEHG